MKRKKGKMMVKKKRRNRIFNTMQKLLFTLALLTTVTVNAQTGYEDSIEVNPPPPIRGEIIEFYDQEPEFPGGQAAMYKFISDSLRYPKPAIENGFQGTVYVGFIVEKDGVISNIDIKRSPYELLSREAKRIVGLMPNWTPGKKDGEAVRVQFMLPVKFTLR